MNKIEIEEVENGWTVTIWTKGDEGYYDDATKHVATTIDEVNALVKDALK